MVKEYVSIHQEKHTQNKYNISNVSNTDELNEWLINIDKRKVITIDHVRHFHDMNCGAMVRDKAPNNFTLPAFKLMTKLVKNLDYANCILRSVSDMATLLGCGEKNIKRTLSVCGPLVRCADKKEVKRGFVKLYINPAYGWKYENDVAYLTQQNAICDWYKNNIGNSKDMVLNKIEFTEEFDNWLNSFSSRLKEKVNKIDPFESFSGV